MVSTKLKLTVLFELRDIQEQSFTVVVAVADAFQNRCS